MYIVMDEVPASWYCGSEKSRLAGLYWCNVLNVIINSLIGKMIIDELAIMARPVAFPSLEGVLKKSNAKD